MSDVGCVLTRLFSRMELKRREDGQLATRTYVRTKHHIVMMLAVTTHKTSMVFIYCSGWRTKPNRIHITIFVCFMRPIFVSAFDFPLCTEQVNSMPAVRAC